MLYSLPPEIISNIYLLLSPTPPLPPSRQFVPHFRQSLFHSLDISTFNQITRLSDIFSAGSTLVEYVKRVDVGFVESTEQLLTKFERNPSIWNDLLIRFEGLREIKCRDWMSASLGILSTSNDGQGGRGGHLAKLKKATVSVLLTQLNKEDFVRHRLSVLGRYSALEALEVVVQPFDPSSSTANAFELFPSVMPFSSPSSELDGFPPASIHQVKDLTLVGPLCDRRLQTVLASFDNLETLNFFDLFSSSQNLSPLLATLRSPQNLEKLKLSQLYSTSMPINLPPSPNISFTPFRSLSSLEINVPLPSLTAQDLLHLPSLSHLIFSSNSTPSFDLVHKLILSNPPSLNHLNLSHISGSVGPPISRETYPLVLSWLSTLLSSSPDESPSPNSNKFPIEGWEIPVWPTEFDPNLAEVLFALASSVRISLEGSSLISAMLCAYVVDKQLESWKELLESEEGGEDGSNGLGREERGEMEQVFGDRRFWDALALRYRARLGLDVPAVNREEVGRERDDDDEMRESSL
ncbi:hypothetical protein JCM16303_000847 [Sporobolomyces ruberrimus]